MTNTKVQDGQGNEIEADDYVKKILQTVAATIEHDIFKARIFEEGQLYFIAVQTNVNWQDPCDFYRYDADAGKLELLYSWDNVDVLDVALPE